MGGYSVSVTRTAMHGPATHTPQQAVNMWEASAGDTKYAHSTAGLSADLVLGLACPQLSKDERDSYRRVLPK